MGELTNAEGLMWSEVWYMAPEALLGVCFLILVVAELFLPKSRGASMIGGAALASLIAAFGLVIWQMTDRMGSGNGDEVVSLLGDSYRIDDYGSLVKLLLLAGTILVALLGMGSIHRDHELPGKGEFYYLLLPAAIGGMMMASSANLVTLYIGLELLSITTYVLVALRKRSVLSSEAAFKYVVTGGVSSAFILYGISYIYGVTGSLQLSVIADALPAALEHYEALLYVGFGCMLIGFAVKIAAAPFHVWAPDVYQGAPTPISAFLAVVSKGAALAVVLRIMFAVVLYGGGGSGLQDDLFFGLKLLGAIAMLVGSVAALKQMNAKRMLALSGVANAGYLLVPISLSITVVHSNNVSELIFYLAAYLLMTIGAFGVLTVVSRAEGHDELRGFAGMYYRAPWTAAAMTVLVLSLAGLPVSAGFFGKLFILLGAANAKAYWLVAVMVVSSVISYYFYFGILRQMFMRSEGAGGHKLMVPVPIGIVIWFCVAATLALGLFPGLLLDPINQVFSFAGDLMNLAG
ncbi:NADH-quinone oxidoreductase subunit N [Paenibacillus sp. HB172176]|uniref:NADH-quinone oxidoreductase subunit N n=1 Tax=Paenibacillus sp. HB172176 TaxID=2493690 RepID=UPI00143B1B6B|nr:NADH-quinone oxidoreductase subunit N [Paenibacillus sp. HB172176]